MEAQNLRRLKAEKLLHYSERDPVKFLQLDGFANCPVGDGIVRPDTDGDCLFSGETIELMSGGPAVRVLITQQTTVKDAIRLLEKIINWIKTDPELLEMAGETDVDMPF